MNKLFFLTLVLALVSCAQEKQSNESPSSKNQFHLVDVYEQEVLVDCDGNIASDKIERRVDIGHHRINPIKNIPIDVARFRNVDTGAEFKPSLFFPGSGNDMYKNIRFCQMPFVPGCDLKAEPGDNRIEYIYMSRRGEALFIEEQGVRTFHLTLDSVQSDKICKRTPKTCPMGGTASWSECQY